GIDEARVETLPAEPLGAAPEPLGAAGRELRGSRGLGGRRAVVVVTECVREAAAAQDPDLHPCGDEAEQVARPHADVVVEAGAAARALLEPGLDAHLDERPARVAPYDPEPVRPHPLEGLLLPLDRHAEPPQPE